MQGTRCEKARHKTKVNYYTYIVFRLNPPRKGEIRSVAHLYSTSSEEKKPQHCQPCTVKWVDHHTLTASIATTTAPPPPNHHHTGHLAVQPLSPSRHSKIAPDSLFHSSVWILDTLCNTFVLGTVTNHGHGICESICPSEVNNLSSR